MSWGNCSKAEGVPKEAEDAVGDGTEEEADPKRAIIGNGDTAERHWQHEPEDDENCAFASLR